MSFSSEVRSNGISLTQGHSLQSHHSWDSLMVIFIIFHRTRLGPLSRMQALRSFRFRLPNSQQLVIIRILTLCLASLRELRSWCGCKVSDLYVQGTYYFVVVVYCYQSLGVVGRLPGRVRSSTKFLHTSPGHHLYGFSRSLLIFHSNTRRYLVLFFHLFSRNEVRFIEVVSWRSKLLDINTWLILNVDIRTFS